MQNSGIIKFNELSELISLQVQNSKIFQSNNPAFYNLDKIEQDKLLTKYVYAVLNENFIRLNNKTNNVTFSCASQYDTAKNRCQRDLNLHGAVAIVGCFTGPWTCAMGTLLAGAEHTNCMSDAKEDYQTCLNNVSPLVLPQQPQSLLSNKSNAISTFLEIFCVNINEKVYQHLQYSSQNSHNIFSPLLVYI